MFTAVSHSSLRPAKFHRSGLALSLLNFDHDLWTIHKQGQHYTLHQDFKKSLPSGRNSYLVIDCNRGVEPSMKLCLGNKTIPLTEAYRDELTIVTEKLIEREYCIGLFNRLALTLPASEWWYSVHFNSNKTVDRFAQLRYGGTCFAKLVASQNAQGPHHISYKKFKGSEGIIVVERGDSPPIIDCQITYPRPITCRFSSSQLRPGLRHLTQPSVAYVQKLEDSPTTWSPPEPPEWR